MIYELFYRTINMLKWGAGTGADLTDVQIDSNFSTLEEWIKDLIANIPAGDSIANIVPSEGGKSLTIFLQSGTTFGPFDLPMGSFRFLETGFLADQGVFAWDLFVYERAGMYLVLQDHVMAATFDPNAANTSGNLYRFLFNPFAAAPAKDIPETTDGQYVPVLLDANKYLRFLAPTDFIIPHSDDVPFELDTVLSGRRTNGLVTVTPASGSVTINPSRPGFATAAPWDGASFAVKLVGDNEWDYIGPGVETT